MARRPPRSPVALLEQPPLTDKELEAKRQIILKLQEAADLLLQRNLNNAVLLAQQAARRRGPLVEHFQELGRRFGSTLYEQPQKPKLRVIEGRPS